MMADRSVRGSRFLLQGWTVIAFMAIFAFAATRQVAVLAAPLVYAYLVLLIFSWKQAYWLLLLLLPVSVQLGLADNTLSLTLPAEPMMWLFMLLCPVLFLWKPASVPLQWWLHPLVVIVLLQLIWLGITVMYSETFLLSLKFLLAKLWMLACFFMLPVWIFKQGKDIRSGFIALCIPIAGSTFIILLRHALMGFRFADMNHAVELIYYNHVEYATVISMFLPAIITAFVLTPRQRYGRRLWWLGCVLLFLTAIYFSYARAAMLAVAFSLWIAFMVRIKLVQWVMPVLYMSVLLLVLFMLKTEHYAVLRPRYEKTIYHKTFESHMQATFQGSDASSMERLYRWTAALRMSTEKPLTGFGPNAFYTHYRPYALPSFKTYSSVNSEHSTTHNYLLYMLAEQGYPGLLLYALLMAVIFSRGQKIYHRSKDPVRKKYCLALIMMIAACFVNNFFSELIETPKIGALFYLSVALLVMLDIQGDRPETLPAPVK